MVGTCGAVWTFSRGNPELTDVQAREILALDNVQKLKVVTEWAERPYPWESGGVRLSPEVSDMFLDRIRTHENAIVRSALAIKP